MKQNSVLPLTKVGSRVLPAQDNTARIPESVGSKRCNESEGRNERNENEGGAQYPTPLNLTLITVALSILCMALDNTIITTAIPKITDDFMALSDVGWYGSAYLLTTCAFQLFYGKLYTFLSLKWVYIAAIIIFEVGSAICGAAPNSLTLITGRAIAGLGAAGIFSGAVLIISTTMPLEKRPAYMALIGSMYGIACVAGPLIGGALTSSSLTWRWCFYINLPIGFLTVLFILAFYHPKSTVAPIGGNWIEKLGKFDIPGTLTFLPMIVCLLLALQWGGSKYAFSGGRIIALFVLFGLLSIAFVSIQVWKQDNATLPPRVFARKTVAGAAFFAFALGGAYFTLIYWIPIWFQAIQDATPLQSGIRTMPLLLSLVIAMLVCGALTQATGQYAPFIIASAIIMAIGAGLISFFRVTTDSGQWISFQIVFGIGVGLGYQTCLIAIQATLTPEDIPVGTAIIMFSQMLGGTLFISIAQSVFTNRLVSDVTRIVPGIDRQLVINTGATEWRSIIPARYLTDVQAAYNDSLVSTFYVATAMAAVSIFGAVFIEWKNIRRENMDVITA